MIKGDSKEMENWNMQYWKIPMLKRLETFEWPDQLEPYLSMALSRVELISMDEFNQRIS